MKMTDLILKYLSIKTEVKIPGFGIFQQKNVPAFYDERLAALLPPAKEFFFTEDFNLKDENFIQFVAKEKNIDINESYAEIAELVNYWKFTLQNKIVLEIPDLGTFYFNDQGNFIFKGKHFSSESPENFGLEELNLSELKNRKSVLGKSLENEYKTSRNPFWRLLLIIPVTAIVYFGTQNPELIFGKKSFKNLKKTKTDSVVKSKNLLKDSIKIDSAKSKTLTPKLK